MKTITQRELAARSKAVLDDVEAGETYHITGTAPRSPRFAP
ncbi:hypothetical protein OG946_18290 [Streptomyces sp. NBC_01808]|nr:hypothetical protein [Streptomyces sp. NBC_01808]WSA39139.1 hypothetical protein OG946_18290 [Streptomyces sp. NBC_01808]